MGMKAKKRKRKLSSAAEPQEVMGQGYNMSTGVRIVVMGDAGQVKGLYVIRDSRPKHDQGVFYVDFMGLTFFMDFVGRLMLGPTSSSDPDVNPGAADERPPKGYTQLMACGQPGAVRLWAAAKDDGTFFMGLGTHFAFAKGEDFTLGDLKACGTAINTVLMTQLSEEDQEIARALQENAQAEIDGKMN